MLAKGTSDPYTRFITPEEFDSMRKYDVTGVGLHLGTSEEFVRKTGLQLPPGHDESEVCSLTLHNTACNPCIMLPPSLHDYEAATTTAQLLLIQSLHALPSRPISSVLARSLDG